MSKAISVPTLTVNSELKKRLLEQLPKLSGKKILIVGDCGLDEYILGDVRRISPEAPVPVLEVEGEDLRLGLAANVAINVKTLGGTPMLLSVVGKDLGADRLSEIFKKSGIDTSYLIIDPQRPTTRKIRIMAKHHHMVRVDYELRKYLNADIEQQLIQKFEKHVTQADAVIIEDYAKGVISESGIKQLIGLAHKSGKKVLLDPHQTNRGDFYAGVDLIKPNYNEALALAGVSPDELKDNPNRMIEVGHAVQKITGAKEVVMTRGKDGMMIFSGQQITQVPTYARQVFDVAGAGDTVIAALALGLSSGLTLTESCMLANFAAGVVVGQVGCVPCTIPELKEYMQTAGT